MDDLNFTPLGNKLLIKIKMTEKMSEGGIIIPTERLTKTADVIKVGPDVNDVVEGDTVMLEQLEGAEVKLNGESYHIIIEENVVGIY